MGLSTMAAGILNQERCSNSCLTGSLWLTLPLHLQMVAPSWVSGLKDLLLDGVGIDVRSGDTEVASLKR